MVTAGANQAFTNVAVALLDASDKAVLFSPYYFNHLMAVQVEPSSPTIGQVLARSTSGGMVVRSQLRACDDQCCHASKVGKCVRRLTLHKGLL